jgi:3-oxoacyl-[acyl-carrier protein] reductase
VRHAAADLSTRLGSEAAFDEAARVLGGIDAVVYAASNAGAVAPARLTDSDETAWRSACDTPLRSTLFAFQGAFRSLAEGGGRLIVVLPTVGISGAARFVALATLAEGQRVMAKVGARKWGRRG